MSKQTECKGTALAKQCLPAPHIARLCTQGGSALGMSAWVCLAHGSEKGSRGWRVFAALLGSLWSVGSVLRAFLLLRVPCSLFQLSLPQTIASMADAPPWTTTPQHLQMPKMSSTLSSTIVLVWFLPPCISQLGKNRGFPFLTHHCGTPGGRHTLRQKQISCFGT